MRRVGGHGHSGWDRRLRIKIVPVDWRPGFVGMSLRSYSPTTGLWSIYWLDNKTGGLDAAGNLLPPVVGRFDNGVESLRATTRSRAGPSKIQIHLVRNRPRSRPMGTGLLAGWRRNLGDQLDHAVHAVKFRAGS